MDCGIAVELRGVYGEFIPGYIVGYENPENLIFQVHGTHSVDSIPHLTVHPSQLRKPPRGFTHEFRNENIDVDQSVEVILGKIPSNDEVEQFSCKKGEITPSWWPAQVLKQKGDFIILDLPKPQNIPNGGYQPLLPSFENVVERCQVRPSSVQKMLSVSDFYMTVLEIPKEFVEIFKEQSNIENILRLCGQSMLFCTINAGMVLPRNISVDLENETKANFLVISTSRDSIFKIETLGADIVNKLRTKATVLHQIEALSRRCKDNKSEENDTLIHEEFAVSPDLIGHSIGAHGVNIQRARNLDGIVSVVLIPERCTFKVAGKTKEAVENAKLIIEYANEVMQVPDEYISRIIGQKNRYIQTVVDRVGLSRIRVQSAEDATVPNCVPFVFTGTRAAINDAKLLINFNIDCLQEIDNLEKKLLSRFNPRFHRGEGDERNYRRQRSSKSNSEGRNGPIGGWRTSDHTNMEGDTAETSEPELKNNYTRQNTRPRQQYRQNIQRTHSPPHLPNINRQNSLPPFAKNGDVSENHMENGEGFQSQKSSTLNRPKKNNQRRNKKRTSGDLPPESREQEEMINESTIAMDDSTQETKSALPARRIGRVPLHV